EKNRDITTSPPHLFWQSSHVKWRCGATALEQIPAACVAVVLKLQHSSPVRQRVSCQEEQRYVRDAIVGQLRLGMLGEQRGYALLQIMLPAHGLIRFYETTVLKQVALVNADLNVLAVLQIGW